MIKDDWQAHVVISVVADGVRHSRAQREGFISHRRNEYATQSSDLLQFRQGPRESRIDSGRLTHLDVGQGCRRLRSIQLGWGITTHSQWDQAIDRLQDSETRKPRVFGFARAWRRAGPCE